MHNLAHVSKLVPPLELKFEGSYVKFQCNSERTPVWVYESDQVMPPDVMLSNDNDTLIIDNVQIYHDGLYYCYGYDGSRKVNFLDYGVLIVKG